MTRKIVLIFSILLLAFPAMSQTVAGRFHAGVDWGGGFTLAESHHFNYKTAFGYRVDDRNTVFAPHFTGHLTAYAGVWASDNISVALHAGWAGLEEGSRIIPVFVRTDWYFSNPMRSDCPFVYFDIGSDALSLKQNPILSAVGGGYRIVLYKRLGIDFHMSVRTLQCRPELIDDDSGLPVPDYNINADSQSRFGLEFGIRAGF